MFRLIHFGETGHYTEKIYDEKELADAVTATIHYYKTENAKLKEKNKQLHDAAEQVVRREYEKHINDLEKQLNLSYGEFSSEKEKQAYEDFTQEHMHDRLTSRYNGGRAPYLIPTGTGIGTVLKVVCPICGESKDITDTKIW